MKQIEITIPGEPPAWIRAGLHRSKGRPIFFDRNKPQKGKIKQYILTHLNDLPVKTRELFREHFLKGAYEMEINFLFTPPASMSKSDKNLISWGLMPKITKPDTDNLSKIILDAANGMLYKDDAQIVSLAAKKRYSHDPKTIIKLKVVLLSDTVKKMLKNISMDEVETFANLSIRLIEIYGRYRVKEAKSLGSGSCYHNDIVYLLSRMGMENKSLLTNCLKNDKVWMDCEEFNMNDFASGEGKTLC